MTTAFPLEIFYDGSCVVCSAEMDSYRNNNPDNRLTFIDISAESFSAQDYGKTKEEFMDRLHVRDAAGVFYHGVDAFVMIWQVYPSGSFYRLLSALVGFPGINLFSRFGYSVFARYRHLLPKKQQDCSSGTCELKS
mgnify:CR=1 FL=1